VIYGHTYTMTEIAFTTRTATVFKRCIETHLDDWVNELIEIQKTQDIERINDPFVVIEHDGWDLSMMIQIEEIDDADEDFDWDTIRALILIDGSNGKREKIYKWTPLIEYKPEQFDELVKKYRICLDCDRYCWKDTNFCKKCYPFITEHTEDCCCCLDRSLGVWYKLTCGHILHQRCYNRIGKESEGRCERKCPLCRAVCDHNDCIRV
jgi:hypothetical protein